MHSVRTRSPIILDEIKKTNKQIMYTVVALICENESIDTCVISSPFNINDYKQINLDTIKSKVH